MSEHTAENDAAHVVTVVYDFQGRGLHSCLRCHYAGFSAPELPCPGPAPTPPADGRDPKPCPKCGEVCTYDGWDHVHANGVGIDSCPTPPAKNERGQA